MLRWKRDLNRIVVDGFVNEPAAGNGMEDVQMAHQQAVKRAVSPDDGKLLSTGSRLHT
jgi:hypothetical protein